MEHFIFGMFLGFILASFIWIVIAKIVKLEVKNALIEANNSKIVEESEDDGHSWKPKGWKPDYED